MRTCYHTHSDFSDGTVPMEQIVQAAIDNDFKILAITDHGPVPFPSKWNMPYEKISAYLHNIEDLKTKYADKITLLKGLEIDYLSGLKQIDFLKTFGLDITVGSVHYVKHFDDGTPFNIDKSSDVFIKGLKEIFDNDIKKFTEAYYHLVIEMLTVDTPDIVAHLTLIEKYNKRLGGIIDTDAQWYRDNVKLAICLIKTTGAVMEINARSYYRGLSDEFVPPMWVLKEAKKQNIPITINGDVHSPEDFTKYWKEAIKFVKAAGYNEIVIFKEKGERELVKI